MSFSGCETVSVWSACLQCGGTFTVMTAVDWSVSYQPGELKDD